MDSVFQTLFRIVGIDGYQTVSLDAFG